MRDYSNLDGEVIDYEIASATQNVTTNPYEEDNFYPMDGEDMSYGIGDFIAKQKEKASVRRDARAERKEKRQERKDVRVESKSTARKTKADAKLKQAEAQVEIGKSLANDGTGALLQSLAGQPNTRETGMKTGVKVLIGVLVLGAIGGIAYFMLKKKK
jgi:cobalamin biosynthesis Mg chelatase CobN